jgi:predicted CxxxxCH...CXXCH cytochrome family protein
MVTKNNIISNKGEVIKGMKAFIREIRFMKIKKNPVYVILFLITFLLSLSVLSGISYASNSTAAGIVSAWASGATSIKVKMPYSNDANANNTYTIRWKLCTDSTYPSGNIINGGHSASPFIAEITGLAPNTCYNIEAIYNDNDGVTGTNPQTIKIHSTWDSTLLHNINRFPNSTKWNPSGWGVPGGQYGQFDCGVCHEPRSTNIKNIKSTITAPIGNFPGSTVIFRSTTSPDGFGDDTGGHATSTKICEVCHSITNYHRYNTSGQTNLTHFNNDDCMSCHPHSLGFAPIGGGGTCDACHGPTPSDFWSRNNLAGAHAKHYGDNTWNIEGYDDANLSTSSYYKYNCQKCHDSNHMSAPNPFIALSSTNPPPTSGGSFDASTKTCSNLYCHGNFTGGSNNASPSWTNAASGACGTCHGASASTPPTGGSHAKHVSGIHMPALSCDTCHEDTTSGNNLSNLLNHVNYATNWNLKRTDLRFGSEAVYKGTETGQNSPPGNTAYGTCSNIYCHSNVQTSPPGGALAYGTPTWGGTVTCSTASCHGGDTDPNKITTASHTKHVQTTTYNITCATCHSGAGSNTAKHADYNIDVVISATLGGGSYSGTSQPGDAYGSCSNLYCHSPGTANTGPFASPNVTPAWNTAFAEPCRSCHNAAQAVTPTDATDRMATHQHLAHIDNVTSVGRRIACGECHNATVTGDTTIASYTRHVNKLINVKFDNSINLNTDNPTYAGLSTTGADGATKTPGTAVGSCSNVYCHSSGNLGPGSNLTFRTIAWNADAINCSGCHGDSATNRAHPTYDNGGAGHVNANSHVRHVESSAISCDVCHINTTTSTAIPPTSVRSDLTPVRHINRVEDVSFNTAKAGTNATWTAGTKTCSSTYCHGTGSPRWGGASLTCGDCHSANNTLAGRHPVHYGTATVATSAGFTPSNNSTATAYIYSCGVCHNSTQHSQGPVSENQAAQVSFDTTIAGGGTYTAGPLAGTDRGFNWTSGTCTNTYCHSPGTKNSAYDSPNVIPAWNTTFADRCKSCHNAAQAVTPTDATDRMATHQHLAHIDNVTSVGRRIACGECHNATVTGDTTIASYTRHVNKLINVKFDNSINLNTDNPTYAGLSTTGADGATKTPGTAVGSCSNVYCHSSGNLGTGSNLTFRTIAWNAAAINCSGCHGDSATNRSHPTYANGGAGHVNANSHVVHVENAGIACDTCHIETTQSTAIPPTEVRTDLSPSRHINRVENVTFNTTKAGASATWTSGTKTCSNIACHGTAQWGGPPMDCVGCHGAALGDRRQVTGTNGDFVRASRHVSNGTTTEIVTAWDCVVCHLEGDESYTTGRARIRSVSSPTAVGHTGRVGSKADVNLRNVDMYTTGWIWNRFDINDVAGRPRNLTAAQKSAMRNDMDRFCLTCHDSDTSANPATIHDIGTSFVGLTLQKVASGGGSASIKANTNGLLVGTAAVGTLRFKPFNQNDNGLNAFETHAAIRLERTTRFNNNRYPIDVRGQFNYLGRIGTNWASHHNLNIFQKRYSTRSSTVWPAAAWTTYVTKEGTNIQIAGETAGLHCSDCHLNEINAHGSRNSAFMLSDWAGNDALATGSTSTTLTEICVKCHARTTYAEGNSSTASRTSAHNSNGSRCDRIAPGDRIVYIGYRAGVTNAVQLSCLQCHGGTDFGMIHGTNASYSPGNSGTTGTKMYRFMGGGAAQRYYSPNSTSGNLADSAWEGTAAVGCYTVSSGDTWTDCSQHGNFVNPSTINRARPLNY